MVPHSTKMLGTKRTDSPWMLLYVALIATKLLLAIYQPLALAFLTHGEELECEVTGRQKAE